MLKKYWGIQKYWKKAYEVGVEAAVRTTGDLDPRAPSNNFNYTRCRRYKYFLEPVPAEQWMAPCPVPSGQMEIRDHWPDRDPLTGWLNKCKIFDGCRDMQRKLTQTTGKARKLCTHVQGCRSYILLDMELELESFFCFWPSPSHLILCVFTPTNLTSSFTASINLFFGPPLSLLPRGSNFSILLPIYSPYLLSTCLYQSQSGSCSCLLSLVLSVSHFFLANLFSFSTSSFHH